MKTILLSTLIVVAATSICVPAKADVEADKALAKYRTFVGWSLGDGTINAVRIKGQVAGLSTFDEICEPGRFAQYNIGIQSGRPYLVETGGGNAWVSHAGEPKDVPVTIGQDAFTQSLLLCNAFALYGATVVADVSASGTKLPANYILVALSIPNEPVVMLLINKTTGELTSAVINGIASYQVGGLKNIDSKHKIYTRWSRVLPDNTTADMSISAIQLNVAVNSAVFSRTAMDVPPPPDPAPLVKF